jgi:ribosomal protein L40E
MTQKTVGYVKLEWTCPNCQTRNPGPQKTCTNCGTAQPDNVQFEQAAQAEMVKDEAEIAKAKAGADIICYYCGTPNPAGSKTCSQCGADLTQGAARASGQVLGALRTGPAEPMICPNCGHSNAPNAPQCAQCGASLTQPKPAAPAKPTPSPPAKSGFGPMAIGLAVLGGLLVVCCIGFFVLSGRTSDAAATVDSVNWRRAIAIQQLMPVSGEAWQNQVPAGAVVSGCVERQRGTEQRFTGQTREVCGTPYVKDTGSGYGQAVQDCETEQVYEEVPVYDNYCQYTATVWQTVNQAVLTGNDFNPRWPNAPLTSSKQREGDREETYQVIFRVDGQTYTYTPGDVNEFKQFEPGSRWVLKINTFDSITGVEPAQ